MKEMTNKQKTKYISKLDILKNTRREIPKPSQVHGKEKYTRKEKHKKFYI